MLWFNDTRLRQLIVYYIEQTFYHSTYQIHLVRIGYNKMKKKKCILMLLIFVRPISSVQ